MQAWNEPPRLRTLASQSSQAWAALNLSFLHSEPQTTPAAITLDEAGFLLPWPMPPQLFHTFSYVLGLLHIVEAIEDRFRLAIWLEDHLPWNACRFSNNNEP